LFLGQIGVCSRTRDLHPQDLAIFFAGLVVGFFIDDPFQERISSQDEIEN
jgi:hypothetical protein